MFCGGGGGGSGGGMQPNVIYGNEKFRQSKRQSKGISRLFSCWERVASFLFSWGELILPFSAWWIRNACAPASDVSTGGKMFPQRTHSRMFSRKCAPDKKRFRTHKIQLDSENPERKQDKKIIGFFFSLFGSFLLDRHGSMNEQLRLSVCLRPLQCLTIVHIVPVQQRIFFTDFPLLI